MGPREKTIVVAAALAAVAGCPRSNGTETNGPAGSGSTSTSTPASTASSTSTPTASSTATSTAASDVWSGPFTAKVGEVSPPKDAKEKAWKKDPGTAAIGAGTIDLSVPPGGGVVAGTAKGALGDLVASGTFDGKDLRAALRPPDPNVPGAMSGYVALAVDGEELRGALRVSNGDAMIVREAEVRLRKGGAGRGGP